MDTQFIAENPFRILGLTTEASTKQIASSESRIKAFSKVGKTIDFPTDMLILLPPIDRNEETVTAARAAIAQPADRLKYAFFWFVNTSPAHEQAIECLSMGDAVNARQILTNDKTDTLSAYNLGVLDLIELNAAQGVARMLGVLRDEDACNHFVSTVTAGAASFNSAQTSQLFIEQASTFIGPDVLDKLMQSGVLSHDDKSYIAGNRIAFLVKIINDSVEKAKAVSDDNSLACLEAGRNLVARTAEPLNQLRQAAGEHDQQYTLVADRLAEAILSCGINYFNHSFDPDSAATALELYHEAARIAAGPMQRNRCNKEINLLRDIKAKQDLEQGNFPTHLKPLVDGIRERIKSIQSEGASIASVNHFLDYCTPDLNKIRAQLGAGNDSYLTLSSAVANNALNAVITAVNQEQERVNRSYASNKADLIRSIVNEALGVMEKICALDMNNEVTQRYNHNTTILNNMSHQLTPAPYTSGAFNNYDDESDGDRTCGTRILYYLFVIIVFIIAKACFG